MKKTLLLSVILPVLMFSCGDIFGQVTHQNTNSSDHVMNNIDYPRIVRSGMDIPDNFSTLVNQSRYNIDNKGTEFWIMMPRNFNMDGTALYIDITSDVATNGTVELPGISFNEDFTSSPGSITRITLPIEAMVGTNELIENKGIHITANDEVTVYGLSIKQFTSDCFLALPVDILSTQYLAMSYPNLTWTSGFDESTLSQFSVVSPYDNNQVTITPSTATLSGSPEGFPIEITLNKGQTYQVRSALSVESDVDLTGSVIQSSLPIAFFSGNSCASIPTNYAACDIILEQIPPVSTWGNNFVTYPLEGRENGDTWRILSSQDNNNIYIDEELVATLNFGDFYEDIYDVPKTINSSKPVLVMQFSNGDEFDPEISLNGDPFMMLIPPEEQFMDSYTFATPSSGFIYNYVTVTIPTEGISTLLLDGEAVTEGLFTPIGTSGYSAAGLEVEVGSHTLNNTENIPFGIYSYGFNSYDSYGYAGGLSLEFIYEGSAPIITRTAPTINVCQNNHPEDEDILIEVIAQDYEQPYTTSVKLYYSSPPGEPYTMVEMTNTEGDIWSYTVPASESSEPGMNFYFTASDGQLSSSSPTIDPLNNPFCASILPNELPVISHTPVYEATLNMDAEITAEVNDATDYVDEVKLHYRVHGGNPVYTSVEMVQKSKGTYSASIPSSFMVEAGTDYFITAKDNFAIQANYPADQEYIGMNQDVGIGEPEKATIKLSIAPNPVTSASRVALSLMEQSVLTIELFNLNGQKVRTLYDSELPPGTHYFSLNRGTLKSGTYLMKASDGTSVTSEKLIIK